MSWRAQNLPVRIDLTVQDLTGAEQDVAVVSRAPVRFGDLRAQLPALADAAWSDGLPLGDDATVGGDGLRAGTVVTTGPGPAAATPSAAARLHVVGGPDAGLTCEINTEVVTIGRAADCTLTLTDPDVSRRHAGIRIAERGAWVRDLGSTNGTSVDGLAVTAEPRELRVDELIRVGDTFVAVVPADRPSAVETPVALTPAETGGLLVNRAPRKSPDSSADEVALPEPSTPHRREGMRLIGAFVPALAGVALAIALHSPQYLLFAVLSPVTMIATAAGDRWHWRRDRRRAAASFRQRHAAAQAKISAGLVDETKRRRARHPDPVTIRRTATLRQSMLWLRERRDDDSLTVRVGLGACESQLRVRVGTDVRAAGPLAAVPAVVNLRDGPVGIAGPPDMRAGAARWMAVQLAVLHSPVDVELGLLLSDSAAEAWRWTRWLPHLRDGIAESQEERAEYVAALHDVAAKRRDLLRSGQAWPGPWLVLIVDRAGDLVGLPGLASLLAIGADVGITAICLDGAIERLPKACATVLVAQGEAGTRIRLSLADTREAVADQIGIGLCETVARSLAPLVDAATVAEGVLPSACRLLDVLDITCREGTVIRDRWARSDGQPSTTLGIGTEGPLRIDLVCDGPHALIAGTTGAGKSELLQSLVVGLAADHPPDEIAFVLVDYKGGAAFGECARLPHTVGLVTDLDAHLTSRALTSLDAELRRREQLFADANATDLREYRLNPDREPLPRLVIVIDEFASLAEELPAFVTGLVGVAQRGRSLGVHLVLATQRPAGVVSAEIRANTALRIALRVTDPGESADVIGSDVAAGLSRRSPGRAYVRVGTTLRQVQVASVCMPAEPERPVAGFHVEPLDGWRRMRRTEPSPTTDVTDLTLLVAAIGEAADVAGSVPPRRPWLAPLPSALALGAASGIVCGEAPRPGVVSIGLADHPAEQAQRTVQWDLAAGGSMLLMGGPGTGRSTVLAALAVAAAEGARPDDLHVHAIDFGGLLSRLAALPHCGTLVRQDQFAVAATLIARIERQSAARRGDETDRAATRTVLLLDGWESFCASSDEFDGGRSVDTVLALARLAPGTGITVAVTCGRAGIAPRVGGAFGERFVFAMSDRSDFAMAGVDPRSVPQALPPGRAVRVGDGIEVQFAHAGADPSAESLLNQVAAIARDAAAVPRTAMRLRPLPAVVRLCDLAAPSAGRTLLGVAGDLAVPFEVNLFAGARRLLVAGPPRSGRTSLLRTLLAQARTDGVAATVAAAPHSALSQAAEILGVPVLTPTDPARAVETITDSADARQLLLVDDVDLFLDTAIGDALTAAARGRPSLAVVASGRTDELVLTYRGLGADVRRGRCGVVLQTGAGRWGTHGCPVAEAPTGPRRRARPAVRRPRLDVGSGVPGPGCDPSRAAARVLPGRPRPTTGPLGGARPTCDC